MGHLHPFSIVRMNICMNVFKVYIELLLLLSLLLFLLLLFACIGVGCIYIYDYICTYYNNNSHILPNHPG